MRRGGAADTGTSARDILRLAVPAFGALVAQPLFTLIDAAIVATLGTTSLAALGAGAQVFTTVTGLAIFLAYGTTAVVARRVGAGQLGAAGSATGSRGWPSGSGSASRPRSARWTLAPAAPGVDRHVPGHHARGAGLPAHDQPGVPVRTAGDGRHRGAARTAGHRHHPVGHARSRVGTNLALAAYLVLVARWGIAGSAWATVAAEAVAAGLLLRDAGPARAPARRVPAARAARACWSRPGDRSRSSGGRWRCAAVFVLAVVVAARLGDAQLAAYYVTFTVWYLLALGMDALAIAGQALLGRHLGAGSVGTARAVTWQMTRWGVLLGVALMCLVLVTRQWLPELFGDDPVVAGDGDLRPGGGRPPAAAGRRGLRARRRAAGRRRRQVPGEGTGAGPGRLRAGGLLGPGGTGQRHRPVAGAHASSWRCARAPSAGGSAATRGW